VLASLFKSTRIGGDGQTGTGVTPVAGWTVEQTRINGAPIKGGGAIDPDSDWNGDDGVSLNQLWDTHTTDVSTVAPLAVANYTVDYVSNGDCVSPSVHVLTAN